SLPGLLSDARSYAERLFAFRQVGQLTVPEAARAVREPAARLGVEWDKYAVGAISAASDGYPYFLQEFAKATWDHAAGPQITRDEAYVGIEHGRWNLHDGFFASRWARATRAERDYLRAMADDEGPSNTGEVARRLGKKRQGVGPTRASLIAKGLVYA